MRNIQQILILKQKNRNPQAEKIYQLILLAVSANPLV